ncbi:hypothetical protein OSTOST_01397 [Ostertagia ostertagi]
MQAQAYNRTKNFLENASSATDHGAINSELDAVAVSVNELRTNAALLQNDDGSLKNGTVNTSSLTSEALAALQVPGPNGPTGPAGPTGPQGVPGVKGDTGASFDADVRDLFANRALYNLQPKGYSFLALDTGNLYFKLSATSGDWSTAKTFGKGDKGDKGDTGNQGIQGIQGLQGIQGIQGATGAAGTDGDDGVVVTVDTATKTASLIGRTQVSARLILVGSQLSIELTTT